MATHDITFRITFWYQHEPSPISSENVEKVSDGWEVSYENAFLLSEQGSVEETQQWVHERLEEIGPEEMLSGCISEDDFDPDYDSYELDIGECVVRSTI